MDKRTAQEHKEFFIYINSSGIMINHAMGGIKRRGGQGVCLTCTTYPADAVVMGN
jgi:hypothetical protein